MKSPFFGHRLLCIKKGGIRLGHGGIFRGILFLLLVFTTAFTSQLGYDHLKDVHLVNKYAGLSYLEQPAVSRVMGHSFTFLQYGGLDGQTKTNFANLNIPGYFFNIGLTVKHEVISDIPRTALNNNNQSFYVQDKFSHEKSAAMLTFSQKLPSLPIYYGVNAKLYQQKVLDSSMVGFGFDAGVMIKLGGTILGATYNDINDTSYEWDNGTVDQLGAAMSYQIVQLLPFGYVSYVGSDRNDDYLKV